MKRRGRNGLPLMEWISPGDKRRSTGNTINAVVMPLYGDRWEPHFGEHSRRHRIVKPLRHTPETNVTSCQLHFNNKTALPHSFPS